MISLIATAMLTDYTNQDISAEYDAVPRREARGAAGRGR